MLLSTRRGINPTAFYLPGALTSREISDKVPWDQGARDEHSLGLHSALALCPVPTSASREPEDLLPAGWLPPLAAQCPSGTGTPARRPAPSSCSGARRNGTLWAASAGVVPHTLWGLTRGKLKMQPICSPLQNKFTRLGHHGRAGCAAVSHTEESDLLHDT